MLLNLVLLQKNEVKITREYIDYLWLFLYKNIKKKGNITKMLHKSNIFITVIKSIEKKYKI